MQSSLGRRSTSPVPPRSLHLPTVVVPAAAAAATATTRPLPQSFPVPPSPASLRLPSALTSPPFFLPAPVPPNPKNMPPELNPAINKPVTITTRTQNPASSSISRCARAMAASRRVRRRASSWACVRWMGRGLKSVLGGLERSGPGLVLVVLLLPAELEVLVLVLVLVLVTVCERGGSLPPWA